MKLRSLIMLAAIAYTLVIGGSLLFYRLFITYPEMESIALNSHKNDLQIIQNSYTSDPNAIVHNNHEWAKWNDTYEYATNQNSSYIKTNILSNNFANGQVDAVAIFDKDQNHLFSGIKTKEGFKEVKHLELITQDIHIPTLYKSGKNKGLIRVNNSLGYFSSHSIQDSLGLKDPMGQLIFISTFSDDFNEKIKKLTTADLKVIILNTKVDASNIKFNSADIKEVNQSYTLKIFNHLGKVIAASKIQYPTSPLPDALDTTTIFSISTLLMLPLMITVLVYILFLRPMTFIFNRIGNMKENGELSEINIHTHIYEIDQFTRSFNKLIQQIKRYQDKLKNESNTDGLTGLYNRRYFDNIYDKIWRKCGRLNIKMAIVILDIDYFKRYNDHYGHQKGDDALKLVAKQLAKQSRRGNETMARYGGEEFALIIEGTTMDELKKCLSSIIEHIQLLNIEHVESQISNVLTISCGACIIDKPGAWMKDQKALALKLADEALYESKANGRNQYQIKGFSQIKA